MLKPGEFTLQSRMFDLILSAGFLYYLWKRHSQDKDKFFQNAYMMNFGRGFNKIGNIFFTIAGNIYLNKQ